MYQNGEAYISTQRNRIKAYGSTVYLKDKQEFQIELFNPSNLTKAAEIHINGKLISSAKIVIKPGQRIYLERFIDEPKKFLFETYEVDNEGIARAAILHNGDIEVKFYDEYIPLKNYLSEHPWTYNLTYSSRPSSLYGSQTICSNY